MFTTCRYTKQSSLMPCNHPWLWFIALLLCVDTVLVAAAAGLQLAPHFTYLPPSVTPFVATADNASTPAPVVVDLLCRAWPPNALLSLIAVSASQPPPSTTLLLSPLADSGFGSELRHGVLTPHHPIDRSAVRYASRREAVHNRPAALPTDEVALRLSVPGDSARRLESLRLHCLVETAFGALVSRPFRIRAATLGDFRVGPSLTPATVEVASAAPTTVKILRNNVGVVDCHLPVNAYPSPPTVQVELNGSLIDVHNALHSQKYRLVPRPDNRRVSLLIRQFQAQDAGLYRCFFVNPLTGQRLPSPEPPIDLQLIRPQNPFAPTVFTPLAGGVVSSSSADNGLEQAKAQVILANEGDNITLFCVIHAAPPPTVTTYPFQFNNSGHSRFRRDDLFGLLHITNVQPSDSGFYICSERQISSTAQLRVKSLLRLVTTPRDVSVPRLGVSAQFNCATSDAQIEAVWLVNGRSPDPDLVKRSDGLSTLTIPSVSRENLGFYQCIAWRPSSTTSAAAAGPTELGEWVNATAMLTLETDRVLLSPEDVAPFLPKNQRPVNLPSTPESTTDTQAPVAEVIFDNLAVLLSWLPVPPPDRVPDEAATHPAGNHGNQKPEDMAKQPPSVEYRLEYSVQQTAIEVATASLSDSRDGESGVPAGELTVTRGVPATESPVAEGAHSYTAVELAQVFTGFVGFEAIRWSEPRPLKQQVSTLHLYIAGPPLEPEKQYRFRVLAVNPVSGAPIQGPSGWSKVVSMEHISSAKAPEIQIARPLSDGQVQVIWKFDEQIPTDSLRPVSGDHPLPPTSSSSSSNNNTTSGKLFHADHFLILARPVVKPKRGDVAPVEYGKYYATTVNGSHTREGLLAGLNRSMDYQIIVYAVRGTGESRQITRFSAPVFVNFVPTAFSGRYSLMAALANHKVLYLVLGGIAGLMMLVVFVLVLLCMCRQMRDGPRRPSSAMMAAAERKKQNGYLRGNSDAVDGGNGYKNPPAGAPAHHPSSPDTTAAAGQVSLPDYYSAHHLDPYHAQKDPLLSGAAVPSHQLMMGGSQFHPQVGSPPHHQSHHSLLLPANSVSGAGRVFQTGTLPAPGSANQRYYRAQQQPGMVVYNNSNNRATTPGPMLEMTEYAYQQQQQVYAPHQQLPPIPHAHSPDLPMSGQPQLMTSGGNSQQPMGAYYPTGQPHIAGLMTPGGMSLKRHQLPPSGLSAGGSLREQGSAYGTIMQRGSHLTGSFISDQHQLSGTLQPGCSLAAYPTYYQQQQPGGGVMGSHQTLHMASPTPMMQAYHQQQQQQYPLPISCGVYYGQQTPSEMLFVAGGGVTPQQLHQQGFRTTDGESIYSYFSQQHDPTAGGHQHLNALPEENNNNATTMLATSLPSGYVDSGMQTGELNAGHLDNNSSNNNAEEDNSYPPGGGGAQVAGGHRHHRRRRRKQQQQQSSGQRHASESTGGEPDEHALTSDTQAGETQITPLELSEEVKRQLSLSTGNAGTYSDVDPLSGQPSFACPPPPPGYHLQHQQQQQQQSFTNGMGMGMETNGPGRNFRYESPQRGGSLLSGGGCPLPPPNQPPPPPPPPPNAAMAYNKGCDSLPPGEFTNGGFYSGNSQRGAQFYSPPTVTSMDYRQHHLPPGGLLVGPPPRVRDYSEYGIPRGIGLPPTPDNGVPNGHSPHQQFLKGHVNQGQFVTGGVGSPPVNGTHSGNTGPYREGQA